MDNAKKIAGLIGPTLITVTVSEAINLPIWASNSAPLTYLNGCLLFVAGLAVVRAHNVWSRQWPVVITLTGWAAMLAGLFRMFAPEARQGGQNFATYSVLAGLFAVGCLLTFRAYRRS